MTSQSVPPTVPESRNLLAAIVDSSSDAIMSSTLDGVLTTWNRGAERMFGYSAGEILGRSIQVLLPPGHWDNKSKMVQIRAGLSPETYETERVRKDGSLLRVSITLSPVRNGPGEVTGISAILRDVSARRKMEEALEESEEKFKNLVQAIPDIVYKIDPEGRFIFINDSVRVLGYEPEELLGNHFSIILHPDDVKSVSRSEVLPNFTGKVTGDEQSPKLFDERRAGPRMTKNLQVRLVHKAAQDIRVGSVFSFGELISAESSGANAYSGTIGIIRDVTERVREEWILRERQEREKILQQELLQSEKMRALGHILSGTAHELNNPLTSILGYAQLALASSIPDGVKADFQLIATEAGRCAAIVKNLVALARKKEPKREPCDVNRLISDTVNLRAYQMKTDNVDLRLDLDPALPQTLADPHQLEQVFFNIVNNALQAMERSAKQRLAVTTARAGEMLRISFQDSGPGIPPDDLHRVFEPFFTTKATGRGTGLGLSLCYGIVTGHGGKIWAESRPGEGATFVIELPLVLPDVSPPPAEPKPAAAVRVKTGTILVVDDEASVLQVVERYLKKSGHAVSTALSVDKAIDSLAREAYDIVISDHKMPIKNGTDLYTHLTEIHPGLADKFILITGAMMDPDTSRFVEKTKLRVLEKPFNLSKLGYLVEELL